MKRVIINGANGKMGQAVARIIQARPQLGLTLAGGGEPGDGFGLAGDIIIDLSSPQGAQDAFNWAKEHKAACLIGTTNLPERFLFQMQEEHKIPLFYAPNVSLSVYFFGELLKKAAQMYKGYEMNLHEIHHTQKKDAPSGTAKKLAEALDRDLFAASAVEVAVWLVEQPAGFYTMSDYAKAVLKSAKKELTA